MNQEIPSRQLTEPSERTLGDDLLIGAEAVARELNWKTQDGKWNRRRVYYLAEQGHFPIHRVRGLGICARRSALREFFTVLDAPFLQRNSCSDLVPMD